MTFKPLSSKTSSEAYRESERAEASAERLRLE